MQSQLSLSRVSSNAGLAISILFHCFFGYVIYFNHPFMKVKPSEDKSFKIDLKTYAPVAAPVVAPVVSPPPPQPEPAVVPPKPKEIVKKEPVKPKKKKNPEKIVKKQEPTPTIVPEPIIQAEPTPSQTISTPIQNTQALTSQVATAPTMGEFNMQSSAGDENFKKIRKAIEKYKKYPKNAQKMRQQGIAEVRFIYKKNGVVSDIQIVKSSGYTSLDDGAIKCIERASKEFPILERDYRITIPIGFRLI